MTFGLRHMIAAVLTAALLTTICSTVVRSAQDPTPQEKPQEKNPTVTAQQLAMQAGYRRFIECCKTGPEHARLGKLVGKWDLTMKIAHPGTGKIVSQSKGSAEYRWMVDGRWLMLDATYPLMGSPARNITILGYDPYRRRYVQTAISSAHNMMVPASGSIDANGNILFFSKMDEPMNNEYDKVVKTVYRFPSDDKLVIEVFELTHFDQKGMVIRMELTRKK